MTDQAISWLLEESNPAVRYRTQTELLDINGDYDAARAWALKQIPGDWRETSGLRAVYPLVALAECGVKRGDVPSGMIERAFYGIDHAFDHGCEGCMLLTALVKLGCASDVEGILERMVALALPDGGFLCASREKSLSRPSKSCYKANLHALMLLSECVKRGIHPSYGDRLIGYFLDRDLFYKRGEERALVLDGRPGWRTVDTFYPFEPMRVGLQNVVEAFAALGFGRDNRLNEAWSLLQAHGDRDGKYSLDGTLSKPYLPKERVGKPSKWVTFYALLAEKEASQEA